MDNKEYIEQLCRDARAASRVVANYTTVQKNNLLLKIAADLRLKTDYIIAENKKDLEAAKKDGVSSALYDRLLLNRGRIAAMAVSIEEIALLPDPVGRIEKMTVRPSGIRVGQMRIPLGVVAVIYEARPNVTTDIAALCIKSGNAAVLRGGKEAIHSNSALHAVVRGALAESGCPESAVTFIGRTERELVPVLLKMKQYIDIVIPRGGEALIRAVSEESTIPVIKHDKGVCHIFIDESAGEEMANRIAVNAKVQRPGVCNAMETLLIHAKYPHKESLLKSLADCKVAIRGCERAVAVLPGVVTAAAPGDYGYEFLDLILAVKIVDSLDEAMEHIARYGSGHSESIVTNDYLNSERFLREVDSAAVFVNASTRFHDGGEFGLGAEVGISTQKLHARGAMGVEGLTTLKYVVYGKGEVR
ncbi:MAG: glutamate-5-semialdehyde dehydrogenase [Spirochaetes bacterium]|nr:glutamate-5-semialdehyde dehydrogenase [Spirochaetota bacterium]